MTIKTVDKFFADLNNRVVGVASKAGLPARQQETYVSKISVASVLSATPDKFQNDRAQLNVWDCEVKEDTAKHLPKLQIRNLFFGFGKRPQAQEKGLEAQQPSKRARVSENPYSHLSSGVQESAPHARDAADHDKKGPTSTTKPGF